MKKYTIGIDIGGTNFRIGLVDEDGKIQNFIKKSSEIFKNGNFVDVLYSEIKNYMAETKTAQNVVAAAIGIPSIISKDKKTVISTPNIKGLDNINVGDALGEKLGIPVFLDRDVNFLLENDIIRLNLDKTKTVCGFYVGTGFGNAIYINGSFYSGKNGAAGELGHIPLYGIDEKCTCGNVGCSEVRCSGKRLEYLAAKHFPDTLIREVFKYHGDEEIIKNYVKDLAIPIATEINILDPDYVVIAGGVIYMENFPKELLIESIHNYTRKPYPDSNLQILFSEHTQESGVYGSGNFAFSKLK